MPTTSIVTMSGAMMHLMRFRKIWLGTWSQASVSASAPALCTQMPTPMPTTRPRKIRAVSERIMRRRGSAMAVAIATLRAASMGSRCAEPDSLPRCARRMLHDLVQTWFRLVHDWGYLGVFLLMAAESSILPVPSEVVMPPAAYWAAQGRMDFWLVVLMGTAGSWFGSAVSYWVSLWIGRPLVLRWGKYLLITPAKVELAERWAGDNGLKGVFFARLLPVVRHLISIPAGILRLRFLPFTLVTVAGAGIWCWVLAWWGAA